MSANRRDMIQTSRFLSRCERIGAVVFHGGMMILLIIAACSRHRPHDSDRLEFIPPADSLSLEQATISISKQVEQFFDTADSCSREFICRMIDSAAAGLAQRCAHMNGPAIADSILTLVYGQWGIGFDPCDTCIGTLLPCRVFQQRRGACVGVSLIILMLAERLHCPIYGVLLPGHFFCRYDDGETRYNIEPNRAGFRHPDTYYRQRYMVGSFPWYDMRCLTNHEVVGVLCYNVATILLSRKQLDAAETLFSETIRRLPDFAEARGNLALTLAQRDRFNAAESLFTALGVRYPAMPNLALNHGAIAMARRDYEAAVAVYRRGLSTAPTDAKLLGALAEAFDALGTHDSAQSYRTAAAHAGSR
jgi:hypothetical protein